MVSYCSHSEFSRHTESEFFGSELLIHPEGLNCTGLRSGQLHANFQNKTTLFKPEVFFSFHYRAPAKKDGAIP